MNEEELFCKLFPEYAVNGKPLSPYFDLFESGYEQAENRFAELQERIKTLEYRCENIKDTDTMELVALQRENAELQNKVDTLQGFLDRDVEFDNLQKENAELKKLFADCDTCKRTCDIGNCCKFGSDYLPDVEKVLNEQKQLTKAKEIIKLLLHALKNEGSDYTFALENTHPALAEAEQFLNSEVKK